MINIIIFSDLGWNLPLTNNKMMSDASDMLAAALEQMDGIIAGNLHALKDAVMAFTWLSWLFFFHVTFIFYLFFNFYLFIYLAFFYCNSFITSPLWYFHLLAFSSTFRFPMISVFVLLLQFLPESFLNFVLKRQKILVPSWASDPE